jgi:hypothetical protein
MRNPDDRIRIPSARGTISRRKLLETAAAASLGCALSRFANGQGAANWKTEASAYLESLARSDGGYGWEDQEHSHLTPTFAAIGSYHALKVPPPRREALAEFVRTHHPSQLKKLEQEHRIFDFQQIQALVWLGANTSEFRETIRSWTRPLAYLKQYEQHGYPVFQSEVSVFNARALLGLPLGDLSPSFTDYLDTRRRRNGSFNNTPAADGSDGHITNTWWGLQALDLLGRAAENKDALINWLRQCQLSNGGFTWQPKPLFSGVDSVDYTWAAVRALKLLGAEPANRDACITYLHSLANADGGFSDRPGWQSNPIATYRALDALAAFDALESAPVARPRAARPQPSLPADLKIFSVQLEAHGRGSPAEAVDLARTLRIHLWGAKNAKPEWIVRAQAIADDQKVPVTFFISNEEYGTWVDVPGLGTYSHTSDIIAPPNSDFRPSLSNTGVASWPKFREQRLAHLEEGNGRLIWQFGENEELVRLYLDDSVERSGYTAISTFHFGNPDFTNSEPFLHRWRGLIPYVALQDAHGEEPWWFADMTTGFRTVFLATEPTWEGWLNALKYNWVAAIRHDALSGQKTWIHSGSRAILDYVRSHEEEWRWWDNPEIQRPLVSIVAVRPADELEAARPEAGVTLRIRCAWENTPQGLPKSPIAELISFTLDNVEVSPKLVTRKRPNGTGFADHYHEVHLTDLKQGKHVANARVRVIASKVESSRTLEFDVRE